MGNENFIFRQLLRYTTKNLIFYSLYSDNNHGLITQPTNTSFLQNNQRILSIDAFRGITIFVMVFVNDLAGTPGIPSWMGHMPANADAMSFVDVVFPAFLFIAGMSIPFALQNRLQKGDSFLQLQGHIIWRALGLLTLGFFMVNAEDGYNAAGSGIPLHLWLLLFYTAAILTWNVYTFKNKRWQYVFRFTGIAGLIILAFIYHGGDGTAHMRPHWWGILGLIGWAYLYACIFYQLFKGNIILLITMVAFCTAFYIISKQSSVQADDYLSWMRSQAGNAAHTSIVLCGIILSQLFFSKKISDVITRRFIWAGIFMTVLFMAGYQLRPYYKISKIYATPTWCLYSAGFSCIIFGLLYWLTDIQGKNKWTTFFKPAATNPLLTYIIPGILFSLFSLCKITIFPLRFRYGLYGIFWSLFFAIAVMYIANGLNKLRIRMQL
jgi:heparan-alpha-glucosaminide N-acetyltransferase